MGSGRKEDLHVNEVNWEHVWAEEVAVEDVMEVRRGDYFRTV